MSSPHPSWKWPEGMKVEPPQQEFESKQPSSHDTEWLKEDPSDAPEGVHFPEASAPEPEPEPESQRHYPTRQCRICLEEVDPSFEPAPEGVGSFFTPKPKVEYISADPESGRLIRPCKCRGSQQYVHEGCLQDWRHADPRYARRNFWECPTCKFKYRLERMKWSRYIQSTLVQLGLTVTIMLVTVFLLGFVADPIINLYLEPGATLGSLVTGHGVGHLEFEEDLGDDYDGWTIHFLKGLTSIGVLGFVKVFFAMNPFAWWNLRVGGLGGARNRRERNDSNFAIIIFVGVIVFLLGLWSWVRAWCRRTLEKAGERVVDVQGDEDEHEHAE
ncbi:RING finger domain protein [Amylocarpus encephaloides]|uniref:RING finger domain protein n=1 Tax=Amylocarpus encephaloides TaxID=45428 RepID=A0A9P7YB59_9HELO|nr:RING finger domain protein [Amylocarpus encephaloides]